ncbi:phosphoinositide 3-kinase regulatory subunit 4-like [Oppia nitens]|uniref:phosphoinositide 3-kinase regulatory subunit 4-like n=1 Tax=Oppia nitens TaxID=1686743 RepID=UPI0023DCD7EA|nr:phosphoinositide 3-kinase regulatory subunit 4-like [Oppia nitens]
MGNALVGTVSQAIHPIDHYLADVPEFQYQSSLGSTRFLKVAKCGHYEGDCVVKVLAVDDPSLPLAAHKQRIEHLSTLTARNVSVAAFHRAVICPSFAYIARQYVRYSLYDRLSTRPFLTAGEKSWLAYQLVKCLDWLHGHGIRHGDIKLENILITSSLWLVITDLATYKPVLLPDDNPSDFSYFFDTSRRRCCNIAPERFVSDSSGLQSATADYTMTGPIGSAAAAAAGANSQLLLTPSSPQPPKEPQLTPEMDMFSIGCVLAELFSDDAPNGNLFDLAELLAFRVDQYYPTKALDSISNETIRELVKNLISLQPTERKLSGQILAELSGSLFPGYMSTLYDYLQQLVRLPPDAKVIRLSRDLDQLLSLILSQEPHGLLLVLVVITSTMRALKHIHCKLLAQRLACKIAAASPIMSAYITDRLLPYLLHSLTDSDPRVRAEAVYSITITLEQVDDLPASDNNVFTDYILPVLCQVVSDQSAFVRLTLAANISRLSKVSLNFLSQSCDQNYDEELTLLHNSFQLIVTQLLTDGNNCVRRTLLLTPYSCANLCVFFGRQKTNDLILSHIITFLNDKNDFQLRASFFDNIIVIASYLGSDQCSKILQPLLQQGLSDAEEIIIYKIITSMTSLIEQGLLKKSIIYELLREAVPLLSHPNLWINQSMISLILTLCSRLSLADISCKIKPLVDPNLQRQIHSLKNGRLLKDSLYPLLPRSVYDLIVGQSKLNIDRFFECLIQRKYLRQVVRHHQQSVIVLEDALYTRLTHEGINEQIYNY